MFQNLLKKIHTILKELILFKEIEMQDNELNPDALEIINDVRMAEKSGERIPMSVSYTHLTLPTILRV